MELTEDTVKMLYIMYPGLEEAVEVEKSRLKVGKYSAFNASETLTAHYNLPLEVTLELVMNRE